MKGQNISVREPQPQRTSQGEDMRSILQGIDKILDMYSVIIRHIANPPIIIKGPHFKDSAIISKGIDNW
jgi:hypothetical protein